MSNLTISTTLPAFDLLKTEWSFKLEDIISTIRIIAFGLTKALLVYFVLDLLYIVLFSVSSFIDYIQGEITDIEKKKEDS